MRILLLTIITAATLASNPLQAALVFVINDITSTSMTFTLSGNISGSTPTLFSDRLVLEDVGNADWITGPGGGPDETSGPVFAPAYLSADPLSAAASQGSLFFNNNNSGNEDTVILDYDANLTAADSGTGISVTLSIFPTWSFNPENITELSLSWGINSASDEPYSGTFQSSSAVPESSHFAGIAGFFALSSLLLRRRRI